MKPGDNNNMKESSHYYLIKLHKWKSAVALTACCATFIFTLTAIVSSLIQYSRMGWTLEDYFRYFTTLSNILAALAAVFTIPFAINGLRKKRFVYPRWLFLLHYTGTICTTMTFVFAMVFILPWNPEFAVGGTQLYLHVICPIAILVSFELVESGYQITKRNTLACLIPFLIYSLVYVVNVVLLGETNGGREDLYMLNTFVPFYLSLPAVWLLAYVIATLIRILSNRLDILRRNHLLSFWKEDADPIELNIEIYGLGRYNGMHDTRNELSIPYDLLELFAERYSRDPDDLLKIYMKGMMDALKMH